MAKLVLRPLIAADAAAVQAIYQAGIDTGHATFQAQAGDWADWDSGHLPDCRLVAEQAGQVCGWAALSPVSSRCVYQGVAEVSLYVAAAARGQRVGSALLKALVAASEQRGFWTLQAGIFPENSASLALHRQADFRVVGVRERLGRMAYGPLAGVWRDVLMLERRSHTVGGD